jgi:glycosyltransferase involved in cell wall biosynthesis
MVSVCIPTYNKPHLFVRCLDSVLQQDYADYEIIVSDDSTNDLISDIVRKRNIPNLSYVRNHPALGAPANWNNAMQMARGEFIKIMHHDDYFTRNDALSLFIKAFKEKPGAGLAFCSVRIYYKESDDEHIVRHTRTQLVRLRRQPEFLFFKNIIGNPSATMFRPMPGIEFNSAYRWLVDVDFYIRYLQASPVFAVVKEPVVTTVDGEEGQITQEAAYNRKLVISENLELFSGFVKPSISTKRATLYFEELFNAQGIHSDTALKALTPVPANLEDFVKRVFLSMPHHKLWKRFIRRLLTSRYNKRIFRFERF